MLPEEQGQSGFTFRAVIIAILVTLFLLASSSYIALKLGALPWPIILAVIVCTGIIKLLSGRKKLNLHEINVAQAGSSIGGLMASALVFTIPGIWFLQKQGVEIGNISPWTIALICLVAGILGVLLSVPLRRTFVDEEKLPYPSGTAGAELLKSGKHKGILKIALIFGLIAGIFAMSRELYFAAGFTVASLAAFGIYLTLYPMPLAAGVGYILGFNASFSWFIGSVIGWLIIIPLLVTRGFTGNAITLVQNLGMGLVLGAGLGFFLSYVVPRFKKIFGPVFKFKDAPWYMKFTPIFSLIALVFLIWIGTPLLASIITIVGVWVMVAVAARMTGETNIDPLEQFGIFVTITAILIYSLINGQLSYEFSFLVAFFVSVACAIAGDIGQDYKSAKIIGTKASDIVKIDLIAVVFAAAAAPFVLEVIKKGYLNIMFTPQMPAPQAQLVAGSITGFAFPKVFLTGLLIGVAVEIFYAVLKKYGKKINFSMMPLGIGMFLGLAISIPLFIGGLIRVFADKKWPKKSHLGIIVAAAIMGGEGIAGFLLAAIFVGGTMIYPLIEKAVFAQILLVIFVLALLLTIVWRRNKNATSS